MIKTTEEYLAALTMLSEAAAAYYKDGTSTMSDFEFDSMYSSVQSWELIHGLTSTVTSKVAAGAATGTVRHATPMLSLANIYAPADAVDWARKRCLDIGIYPETEGFFSVEPKLDGSAVSIKYHLGEPIQMLTRGDGEKGENITHNIDMLDGVPTGLGSVFSGTLRGEVVMTTAQFEDACDERMALGKDVFRNPRNACAGILGTDADKRTLHGTKMTFVCYDSLDLEPSAHFDSGYSDQIHKLLREAGFITPGSYIRPNLLGIATISEAIAEIETKRPDFPFEIDGVVIKFGRYSHRNTLGANSKAPRWATAYKFPNLTTSSKVVDIITNVGKSGRISFKAQIEPVDLMGTTVTFATLHNLDFIAKEGIGIGSTVQVERAADVIPRVSKGSGGQTYVAPTNCPKCSGPLVKEGIQLMCRSDICNLPAWLEHAVGRDALDCDGAGLAFIEKAIATYPHTIRSLSDFFGMGEADIKHIDGYAGKAGDNAYAALQVALTRPFDRLLIALALPMTGRSMSKRIAQHFGSLDDVREATVEDLEQVEKMGRKKSEAVRQRLDELDDLIEDLIDLGFRTNLDGPGSVIKGNTITNSACVFTGKTVYVTGRMTVKKADCESLVQQLGGIWKKSGTPDYIIGNTSPKLLGLVNRGAVHIDEAEFLKITTGMTP